MKIQTKITNIILIMLSVTAAIAITITGIVSKDMIKKEIYNHLEDVAISRAYHIETLFIEHQDIVEILSTEKIFIKALTTDTQSLASIHQRIKQIIELDEHISRMTVLNKNGHVLVSSHIDMTDNHEIFTHGKDKIYHKDIHTSVFTGTHVISVSAPILVNDEFAGIVIIDVEVANRLYQITTNRTGLGETGEIYLINQDGYMITPSRFIDKTFLKMKVNSPKAKECLGLSNTQITPYENYRGIKVIGAYDIIENMNWCLLAEIDEKEAFAPVNRFLWMMFCFFLILIGIGIILAIFTTEAITRPILELLKKTQNIEQGNWDYQVTIESNDEIGQLSKAFDSMTAHLKKSHQTLKTHRDELEKKVARRTAELVKNIKAINQQKISIQNVVLNLEKTNRKLTVEIEERKRAEKRLLHSEKRFRKLFEDGPIGMAIVNREQYFIKVNAALCQMLGYTESELVGRQIADVTYPEDMPQNQKLIKQILNGEIPYYQMEKRYIRKDGPLVWGHLAVSLFYNDHGEPSYFLAKIENITKRKQAEEQIRKLSVAIEQSPNIVIITDTWGNVEYANPKFTEVTGYAAYEIIGKTPNILKYGNQKQEYYNNLWQILLAGGEVQNEFQIQKKNGEVYWELASFSAIKNQEGKITHFLKVAEDISKRKQTELVLQEAKEAAELANRAKSEFIANMSHEIRTPMNAVIGFSELLYSLVTDKKQKGYLDAIQTAGKSLLTLINDILDLAKIEAGRLEIKYEPINPYLIFNELKQIFALKIAEQNLEFIIDFDEELSTALRLDETRLRQVLLNLVGNAIKFTEIGYVKLSAQKIYTQENKINFIITVEDTGIGIPENQEKTIFESFKQQDGQSTRKYGGTGLGLAISKRLVEMMNGQILLKSNPAGGSVFEITLRDVEVSATNFVEAQDNSFDFKNICFEKGQVLVVDDIESNRELIREWLSQVNLEVIEAENGQKAVQLAKKYHPELIIMDIRMPEMDGYEATQVLKNDQTTQNIPIIGLTASIALDDQTKIKAHNFDGYLIKPIKMRYLFSELSHYLKHTEMPTAGRELLEEDTSLNSIAKLPELIQTLEKAMMPIWEDMKGLIEIDAIEEFVTKLEELGKEHNAPTLIHYSENLSEFVQNFDILNIEATFNKFPNIVKQFANKHSL